MHHIGHKLLGVDVQSLGLWLVVQELIANSMHQVGFAQTYPTVNKERVVKLTWRRRHVHRRGASHAVGRTFNEALKRQRDV